jgi:Zn-dependent alcohol dehydrogenase
MKTKAAVLRDLGKDWEITELDLDPPKAGEVLVRWVAACATPTSICGPATSPSVIPSWAVMRGPASWRKSALASAG